MRTRTTALFVLAAGLALPAAAVSPPPAELAGVLKANNCTTCHLLSGRTVVGPAYSEIAARYADDKAAAVPVLAERVLKGSDAKIWGQAPMPPSAKINAAEAEAVVKWILGL
ncbi:c-type cytochrome [Pseudothauera nasutitermitis]|nr:c-type cytochrome [Pseudothauera nasutitermitis]